MPTTPRSRATLGFSTPVVSRRSRRPALLRINPTRSWHWRSKSSASSASSLICPGSKSKRTPPSPAISFSVRLPGSVGLAGLGGVRFDFDPGQIRLLAELVDDLERQCQYLVGLMRSDAGLRDRLETTGILKPEAARDLGVVGIAGRASGIDHDLRRDFPHAAYDRVNFTVPVYHEGDVLRRMQVRMRRVCRPSPSSSKSWRSCPPARSRAAWATCRPTTSRSAMWKGGAGKSSTGFAPPRTAAWPAARSKTRRLQNWPALSEAILGNIIPDFPVVNKSFNLSYSGTDR